jgi:2-dehydro-3-deoxyphosphooctonate aldolase (KDO 8-P synthase)
VNSVKVNDDILVGPSQNLLLIAGPCQIESEAHCIMVAKEIKKAIDGLPISFVFKASYDKANRTSLHGTRGPGAEQGLEILAKVRKEMNLPVITDVHSVEQVKIAAEVVDILQIPAFLCRQTDLLIEAGKSKRAVNIKKGQFLAAQDMQFAAEKVASNGNRNIFLCERGTTFGYRDLIVDMRSLLIMRQLGYPVVFDATHSVQQPGAASGASSGQRQFISALVRAAVAVGIDGLFIECHEEPARAPSDSASMLPLSELRSLLESACAIRAALKAVK